MWDIIVIGGGPAGVSAAIYSASRGKSVLLIEKSKIGGTVRNISTVTHYSGLVEDETGESFSARLELQIAKYNIDLVYSEVIRTLFTNDQKIVYTSDGVYEATKVIIANGTTKRRLGIPGEELEGYGLVATRDYEKYINSNAYVVGGSDGAIKEALFLASKVKHVTIIHFENDITCIKEFKNKLNEYNNIDLLLNSRLIEVKGDKKIEKLIIENTLDGTKRTIDSPYCGVFVYAGSVPNTDLYLDLELQNGYIVVNEKMETNIQGVYACGDIRVKQVRQIATAVSDGAIAAINAAN